MRREYDVLITSYKIDMELKEIGFIKFVKNYGLIFGIWKGIIYIIKSLFGRMIIDLKKYMNDNYKTEVREEIFNSFKIEWQRIGSKQDKIFGRLLEDDYKETCRKIKRNKKRNFRIKLFGLVLPFFVIIVLFLISIIMCNKNFFMGIRNTNTNSGDFNWLSSMYCTVFYMILIIITRIFSKWINIKKYQETWIRHSSHRHEIDIEILRFLNQMEYYEGLSTEERKKIFKKSILSMWDRNQKRFKENMKKDETIDGIVNEMGFIKSKSTNE